MHQEPGNQLTIKVQFLGSLLLLHSSYAPRKPPCTQGRRGEHTKSPRPWQASHMQHEEPDFSQETQQIDGGETLSR